MAQVDASTTTNRQNGEKNGYQPAPCAPHRGNSALPFAESPRMPDYAANRFVSWPVRASAQLLKDVVMTFDPIKSLDIENYGCIQRASFALTPLHALIGPNDSGKSTTLRALRVVTQFAAGNFGPEPKQSPPFQPMLKSGPNANKLEIRYADGLAYDVRTIVDAHDVRESVLNGTAVVARDEYSRSWNLNGILWGANSGVPADVAEPLKDRITTATMIRFDPNALRRPSHQILSHEPIRFADETGRGLAAVYQAINSRDVDGFIAIRDRVRALFPTVLSILVPTVESNMVTIQAKLTDGTVVESPALSEGLLYFLGFAALEHLERSTLFLVEEPENGLHPARIAEVMTTLRDISARAQVVIATHNPLVVNELEGNEVTVVTRDPATGTQVKLLSEVPGYEDALKVYRTGEFWVSYCDGKQELPLLSGTLRQ